MGQVSLVLWILGSMMSGGLYNVSTVIHTDVREKQMLVAVSPVQLMPCHAMPWEEEEEEETYIRFAQMTMRRDASRTLQSCCEMSEGM